MTTAVRATVGDPGCDEAARTVQQHQPSTTSVEANHDALNVARGEIGSLAVEAATLINDFEGRQNPALLDIVEFD